MTPLQRIAKRLDLCVSLARTVMQPRPMILPPLTNTAPTIGLGDVFP
jgi:hypothetical protein